MSQQQPERVIYVSEFTPDDEYNTYRFVLGEPSCELALHNLLVKLSAGAFSFLSPETEAKAVRKEMEAGGRYDVSRLFAEGGEKETLNLVSNCRPGSMLLIRSSPPGHTNLPGDEAIRAALFSMMPMKAQVREAILLRLQALEDVAEQLAQPSWSPDTLDAINEAVSPVIDLDQYDVED